ncbi:MAG: Segregation and condensation protein A [Pseudomonas citronellolis]|nr:MAG: Segregation and condensation protein A [Pseudomonas citronellolis]
MLSTRERMTEILERLKSADGLVPFIELFTAEEGRLGVVVTFMAILELVKEQLVELVQNAAFAPIHVRVRSEPQEASGEVPEDDTAGEVGEGAYEVEPAEPPPPNLDELDDTL